MKITMISALVLAICSISCLSRASVLISAFTPPLIPEFPNGSPCAIQISTSLSVADTVIELDLAKSNREMRTPIVFSTSTGITEVQSSGNTSATMKTSLIEASAWNGGCTVFVTISKDLNLLLGIIEASSLSYDSRATHVGIVVDPTEKTILQMEIKSLFRSTMFRDRHPIVGIVLENGPDDAWTWSVFCYLCLEQWQWNWHNGYPKSIDQIRQTHHKLNSHTGYGSEAICDRDDNGKTTTEIEALERPQEVEYDPMVTLLRMIVDRFNISCRSASRENRTMFEVTPPRPRLKICVLCHTTEWGPHTDIVIVYSLTSRNMYCRSKAVFEKSRLTFFLAPFDGYTWLCLLAVLIVAGVASRSIWYALDTLWLLLGLPLQYRSWHRWFTLLLFLLILPQQLYVAFFTSEVLAPPQMKKIYTNKQLIDEGFRIIDNPDHFRERNEEYLFTRRNITFSNSLFLHPAGEGCGNENISWAGCIGLWPDVGTRQIQPHQLALSVTAAHAANPKVVCDMVEEDFTDAWWILYRFSGPLEEQAHQYVSTLLRAGIHTFWDHIANDINNRRFGTLTKKPVFEYKQLSFNTALKSIFLLCGIMISAAMLVFAWEIRFKLRTMASSLMEVSEVIILQVFKVVRARFAPGHTSEQVVKFN